MLRANTTPTPSFAISNPATAAGRPRQVDTDAAEGGRGGELFPRNQLGNERLIRRQASWLTLPECEGEGEQQRRGHLSRDSESGQGHPDNNLNS